MNYRDHDLWRAHGTGGELHSMTLDWLALLECLLPGNPSPPLKSMNWPVRLFAVETLSIDLLASIGGNSEVEHEGDRRIDPVAQPTADLELHELSRIY